MPATNVLTDAAIRKAAPGEKPRKLSDGHGLYVEIQPNGARWWRLKYRIDGKEKRLSLGVYPTVSLADARKRRDEARALLAKGTHTSDTRKDAKTQREHAQDAAARVAAGVPLAGTFEAVAREWLTKVHEPAVSERYALRSRKQLEHDCTHGSAPRTKGTSRGFCGGCSAHGLR